MENTKPKMVWWKKTLYIFFLLVFLAIGSSVWKWDISIIPTFLISAVSIGAISFFWGELRGKKDIEETNKEEAK